MQPPRNKIIKFLCDQMFGDRDIMKGIAKNKIKFHIISQLIQFISGIAMNDFGL